MRSKPDNIAQLHKILTFCHELRHSDLSAQQQYDYIFSQKVSRQVTQLLKNLGENLDYYDPDSTYEEDMDAYITALSQKLNELNTLQDSSCDPEEESLVNHWNKRYNAL